MVSTCSWNVLHQCLLSMQMYSEVFCSFSSSIYVYKNIESNFITDIFTLMIDNHQSSCINYKSLHIHKNDREFTNKLRCKIVCLGQVSDTVDVILTGLRGISTSWQTCGSSDWWLLATAEMDLIKERPQAVVIARNSNLYNLERESPLYIQR